MNNQPQIITKLIIVILLSNLFFSCTTSYRFKSNVSKQKYNSMTTLQWERLDNKNYLVLHVDSKDQIMELYDVSFNNENKLVMGKLRPFEGAPLKAFNTVTDVSKNEKLTVGKVNIPKKATRQVHFYLSSDYDLTQEEITFSLTDAYIINKSKSRLSAGAIFLITIGVIITIAATPIIFLATQL